MLSFNPSYYLAVRMFARCYMQGIFPVKIIQICFLFTEQTFDKKWFPSLRQQISNMTWELFASLVFLPNTKGSAVENKMLFMAKQRYIISQSMYFNPKGLLKDKIHQMWPVDSIEIQKVFHTRSGMFKRVSYCYDFHEPQISRIMKS